MQFKSRRIGLPISCRLANSVLACVVPLSQISSFNESAYFNVIVQYKSHVVEDDRPCGVGCGESDVAFPVFDGIAAPHTPFLRHCGQKMQPVLVSHDFLADGVFVQKCEKHLGVEQRNSCTVGRTKNLIMVERLLPNYGCHLTLSDFFDQIP